MPKVEDLVSVSVGLGYVEIGANQGYQERIKNIVQKFMKDLAPFLGIRFAGLLK